jgi:hypothetical protein
VSNPLISPLAGIKELLKKVGPALIGPRPGAGGPPPAATPPILPGAAYTPKLAAPPAQAAPAAMIAPAGAAGPAAATPPAIAPAAATAGAQASAAQPTQPDYLGRYEKWEQSRPTMDPNAGNPSVLRRILATAAGAATGWSNPREGYEEAQSIVNAPRLAAEQNFANRERQWQDQGRMLTGEVDVAKAQEGLAGDTSKPDERNVMLAGQPAVQRWDTAGQTWQTEPGVTPYDKPGEMIKPETRDVMISGQPAVQDWDPATRTWKTEPGVSPYVKPETTPKSLDEQYDDAIRSGDTKRAAQLKSEMATIAGAKRDPDTGTWELDEDSAGNSIERNTKTGQTRPAGNVHARGTKAKTDAENDKQAKPYQDVLDEIQESTQYAADPNGSNDYGLLMNFVGVTKPENIGKLRLSQSELSLAIKTRSSLGDVEALGNRIANGEKFTAQQRQQMIHTMEIVGGAAQRNIDRLKGRSEGTTSGTSGLPPGWK